MDRTQTIATAPNVALHEIAFVRGEWHVQAPLVFRIYILLFAILVVVTHLKLEDNILLSVASAIQLLSWHLAGLFDSVGAYRVFFPSSATLPRAVFCQTHQIMARMALS